LLQLSTPRGAAQFEVVPVQSMRTFESVVRQIREHIARGHLKPGDKLPPERQLAEQLQVGRNAVREALRNLENAGLIVTERGAKGGAFIREADAGRMAQAVDDMVQLGSISVDDLTELRIHLLDAVVRLACERATDADIAALQDLADKTAGTVKDSNDEGRLRYSLEFYRALAAATGNRAFSMVVESISPPVVRLLGAIAYSPRKLANARQRFMKCFRARDAQGACREMKALLTALRDHAKQRDTATGRSA
jgi:GntR family transcriptional repressor for pyruvate dehydrogenase complex